MTSSTSTRVILLALALVSGGYGLASAIAQHGAEPRLQFPNNFDDIYTKKAQGSGWDISSPWLRPDLASSSTFNDALQALWRNGSGGNFEVEHARARLRQILSTAPYSAELWLALALLEDRRDRGGPASLNALKMSYLTAPAAVEIMSVRLDTATLSDGTTDTELAELVRGDMRMILTRRADKKPTILQAYRRASRQGKSFIEQTVREIDPTFAPSLGG